MKRNQYGGTSVLNIYIKRGRARSILGRNGRPGRSLALGVMWIIQLSLKVKYTFTRLGVIWMRKEGAC
jgi:hypothetical protein